MSPTVKLNEGKFWRIPWWIYFFVPFHAGSCDGTVIQERNSIESADIFAETLEISSLDMGKTKTIWVPFHGSQPLHHWLLTAQVACCLSPTWHPEYSLPSKWPVSVSPFTSPHAQENSETKQQYTNCTKHHPSPTSFGEVYKSHVLATVHLQDVHACQLQFTTFMLLRHGLYLKTNHCEITGAEPLGKASIFMPNSEFQILWFSCQILMEMLWDSFSIPLQKHGGGLTLLGFHLMVSTESPRA